MFIYTLPILFNNTQIATWWELLVVCLALLLLLWISVPRSEQAWIKPQLNTYLLSGWQGVIGLHWVFWPNFLLLNIALYSTDSLAKSGLITVSSWDEIHLLLMLTVLWWITAVWRCSANCTGRFWSAFARLMTLAVLFEYSLKLLVRIDYPRVFFVCEDLLLDYGSCF
jgi:hypothetical protein